MKQTFKKHKKVKKCTHLQILFNFSIKVLFLWKHKLLFFKVIFLIHIVGMDQYEVLIMW